MGFGDWLNPPAGGRGSGPAGEGGPGVHGCIVVPAGGGMVMATLRCTWGRWLRVLGWLALATVVAAGLGPRLAAHGPAGASPARPAGVATPVGAAASMAAAPAQPVPPILRLHIVANSDDPEDQAVKLQVRDALLPVLAQVVAGATTPDDALARVDRQAERLEARAEAVLRSAGFHYDARVETGRFPYAARRLGETVYPAGVYPAVRVVLGEGAGHNFWCVLFPGLCWLGDGGSAQAGTLAGSAQDRGGALPAPEAVAPATPGGGEGAGVTPAPAGRDGTAGVPHPAGGSGAAEVAGALAAPGAAAPSWSPVQAGGDGTAWQAAPAPRWFLLEWWQARIGRWWASLGWAQRASASH
ncbi:stage II sporulation protein R, SpoIIR family [Thermaerobacter subterraneus DSM 13965]|uniref:Stage II sporulation protein R, SpoIIR family n=2 Tax=Thermaerobacter TaxID=73918 RepID=K6QFQ6_9FIRM|nr:stage II sporulation protein R, SpoIIR family [Thermaerobacter subterraneus DSM 13965]